MKIIVWQQQQQQAASKQASRVSGTQNRPQMNHCSTV